jgi:hypothetical protein
MVVKGIMQTLRSQFLPKKLKPGEVVDFMGMYFTEPKDTEKLWEIIVAFRKEIDEMNAAQYPE